MSSPFSPKRNTPSPRGYDSPSYSPSPRGYSPLSFESLQFPEMEDFPEESFVDDILGVGFTPRRVPVIRDPEKTRRKEMQELEFLVKGIYDRTYGPFEEMKAFLDSAPSYLMEEIIDYQADIKNELSARREHSRQRLPEELQKKRDTFDLDREEGVQLVTYLLNRPDIENSEKELFINSIMFDEATFGTIETVSTALSLGANINYQGDYGVTVTHWIIEHGYYDGRMPPFILSRKDFNPNLRTEDFSTPLRFSVIPRYGTYEEHSSGEVIVTPFTKLLLQHPKLDINAGCNWKYGRTRVELVKDSFLRRMMESIDISYPTPLERDCFRLTVLNPSSDLLEEVENWETGEVVNPLGVAVSFNDFELVREIVDEMERRGIPLPKPNSRSRCIRDCKPGRKCYQCDPGFFVENLGPWLEDN